jgi:arginase family enzyme
MLKLNFSFYFGYFDYNCCLIDPAIAPATGTLVKGGLSIREATYIAAAIAEVCFSM